MNSTPMLITLGLNDHSEYNIQSVLELLFKKDLAHLYRFIVIGHQPRIQQVISSSGQYQLTRTGDQFFLSNGFLKVRFIPCHTITPAELWSGRQYLAPGDIIQKCLDHAIKLGMESKTDVVLFTPFSIRALREAGFIYDRLSTLLSEWTRCEVTECVLPLTAEKKYLVYQNLPFLALAPYPVELEYQKPPVPPGGAELMEIIAHGIFFRKEKNHL